MSSETIAGDAPATTRLSARSGDGRCWQQHVCHSDDHGGGHDCSRATVPADYTSECSDDLILDDASATDNCGEVTIECQRDIAGELLATTRLSARSLRQTTLATARLLLRLSRSGHDVSRATVPDYTSECSDDLILDDASATDNCGEVTIELSSETIAGDAAGNTRLFARSLRRTTLATARLPRRQSRWRTRRLPN